MQSESRIAESRIAESRIEASHRLIASDRVEGTPVCGADGERIGTIERLMINKVSGQVAYAVLRFGGFLGLGEKHLPLPWERLHYDRAHGAYQVNMGADELRYAPAADSGFDWGDRSDVIELHSYRSPPYWGAF
jgi:PRC-barrel domain protein